ncbi:hypothetical protein PF008_g28105 [Phytophthora fragariae]|uniref:ribonuclease H n=1 Tax=Phytophthora fragariae TaxID=53985 RepID=A0A6G0QCZ1_9STRA|nr:hypothetical protein PF008_g28105 [Phytophthora fragariae]
MTKKRGTFFAVAVGKRPGIYRTWAEAEQHVKGVRDAKFKKFLTEAEALEYMEKFQEGDAGADSSLNVPRHEDNIKTEGRVGTLETLLRSMHIEETVESDLRAKHGDALVAFCAGSAPRNGCKGGTAAFAVSFPLEDIPTLATAVIGRMTNNRADCLAAEEATKIANKLDPERHRRLVIYTRFQGLVFAMAEHNGESRWINRWRRNGGKRSNGNAVVNWDIYKALLEAEAKRTISWHFLDSEEDPRCLMRIHEQTHDEAESVARSMAQTAAAH